jgi:hypothetical protein
MVYKKNYKKKIKTQNGKQSIEYTFLMDSGQQIQTSNSKAKEGSICGLLQVSFRVT